VVQEAPAELLPELREEAGGREMSEIKALQEMRKSFDDCTSEYDAVWIVKNAALAMLDRLESEIAERYIEAPLDAFGVPIHMGDTVEGKLLYDNATVKGTVCAYHIYDNDEPGTVYIRVKPSKNAWTIKKLQFKRCRHVKSRTLEDVLCELEGLRGYGNSTYEDVVTRAAELADEIRELLSKAVFEIGEVNDD